VTKMLLRYVHEFKDRHGKTRRYFRRPGFKRLPLSGPPGSDEFMSAYKAALQGDTAPKLEIGADRTLPGTVGALVVRYYRSAAFASLADSTKTTYRGIIERFRKDNGHRRVAQLDRDTIKRLLENRAAKPAAANNWLRILRMLLDFAVDESMIGVNPALSVKGVRHKATGAAPWTEVQIDAFRARHVLGTRARLAMELLYNTAQRRSDVVRFGPQHIRAGVLSFRQQKTGQQVDIPILPELQATIAATDTGNLAFLVTEQGQPFTAAGFGNWFREVCDEAGVKGYSAHGLRKAAATRLADVGCSDHEIMSWGGWQTLKEVQRYTAAANRKRLAQSGADKLATRTASGKPR
jgi:integrase